MCTGSFLPSLASELLLIRALSRSWTLFMCLSMRIFRTCCIGSLRTFLPAPFLSKERLLVVVQFQDGGFLQDGLGFGGAFAGLVDSDDDLLLHLIGVDADQVA